MKDNKRASRLKRFFVDVDTSILQTSHPTIYIDKNHISYKQKFGNTLLLFTLIGFFSLFLGSYLTSIFYFGLFFIPLGFLLNKIFPNRGKIYFNQNGLLGSTFLSKKRIYLYNDIIDIYTEDSPTRLNVYGLLNDSKFLLGLTLNQDEAEYLVKILKAIITVEGNLEKVVENQQP
jgi:hypothetical protein